MDNLLDDANAHDIQWEAPPGTPATLSIDTVLVGDYPNALGNYSGGGWNSDITDGWSRVRGNTCAAAALAA